MRTIADPQELKRVLDRVAAVRADDRPRWGAMTSHRMLCHLHDSCRIAIGEVSAGPVQPGFLTTRFGRWLVIDSPLPWPRGRITAPAAFHATPPDDFVRDRSVAMDSIGSCVRHQGGWGVSAAFGALSPAQWQRLQWRHIDHHLRQFGH